MADQDGLLPGYRGPGTYRHMKGGLYRVHGLGRHEGTGEQFVVYEPIDGDAPSFWLRPREDFDAIVGGVARFERQGIR